jgi:sugar transferase EpsL
MEVSNPINYKQGKTMTTFDPRTGPMNGRPHGSVLYRALNRIFDISASILGLIILLPIMVLISAGILVCMGLPILFRQYRTGLNGRIFELFKFRTMTDDRDREGNPLPDIMRLTHMGRLLRRSSLDELPQLWNVLKGDMSIVGPRPLLPEYLPLYSKTQFRRHLVKPGIVGWAQVNGRNSMTWEEKFELDLYYVENQSIRLDMMIIIKAIKVVLSGEGLNQSDESTMERFTGN